ncbi:MAG TPA: ArsA family ATPase [bacterium]|nr:ArsA family ATPase [bacterium]
MAERDTKQSADGAKLEELLDGRKIIVCVGSGGVGKTTTSASLALKAAQMGKKVCVLTIDPAKRLANSMGLKELGNQETRIPRDRLESAGAVNPKGELWAMMLDTKRTWDDLVGRFAADTDQRDRILANHYYQQISSALAGSQEFMAMEKLNELSESGKYDLLVLDTPPTRHALDFLDAPKKMMGFMDESVLKLFLNPGLKAGKLGLGLLKQSGAWMFKVLEKVTGFEVLRDLSDFIGSFSGMYGGFHERAAKVEALLREDVTRFLLVTSPNALTVEEAIFFYKRLIEYKMPFGGFVVNRVHPDALEAYGAKAEWKRTRKDPEKLLENLGVKSAGKLPESLAAKMAEVFEEFQALSEVDSAQIELLQKECKGKHLWRFVPAFEMDVHDLSGLARVNQHLFS